MSWSKPDFVHFRKTRYFRNVGFVFQPWITRRRVKAKVAECWNRWNTTSADEKRFQMSKHYIFYEENNCAIQIGDTVHSNCSFELNVHCFATLTRMAWPGHRNHYYRKGYPYCSKEKWWWHSEVVWSRSRAKVQSLTHDMPWYRADLFLMDPSNARSLPLTDRLPAANAFYVVPRITNRGRGGRTWWSVERWGATHAWPLQSNLQGRRRSSIGWELGQESFQVIPRDASLFFERCFDPKKKHIAVTEV